MTPLQSAYLARLKANAIANLEYFKRNFPALHALLAEAPPATEIDLSDQCDATLKRPGMEPQPVARAIVEMEKRLRDFEDIKRRPMVVGFQNMRVAIEGEADHGDKQSFHYSNLDADFPNRIRQHFIKHYPNMNELLRDPHLGGRNIPIVMVFGAGLGWHLHRLVLEYDIRHLILIEPDIEQFRLSLFFHDYVAYGRLALEKGTSISFVTASDPEEVGMDIVRLVQISHPPPFIHGAALFFATPDEEFVAQIKRILPFKLWHAFFGLGYFDDELISIRHTFLNLQRGLPVLQRRGVVDPNAVAFIIGSGPSLDALKPLLEQYGERAVLFSCGTALAALEHAGIVPDFHVEKERPNIVYDVLTHSVSETFRKRVRFIGASVVHPEVPPLFAWTGLIAKSSDSSVSLIWPPEKRGDVVVLNVQPTVTNTALCLAAALGFKTIYLIGVDFGFADQSRHHSAHTVYIHNPPEKESLRRLFANVGRAGVQVAGNFGGTVHSTQIFNAARMQMEHDIQRLAGVRVFNPNHGARIEGAIPIAAEDIRIEADFDKAQTLAAIEAAFAPVQVDLQEAAARLLDIVDGFTDELRQIVTVPLTNKRDVLDVMDHIYQYVFDRQIVASPQGLMFRGTLIQMMAFTYQMISIIGDEGEAAAKAAYDFNLMLAMLDRARGELVRTLEEVGALPRIED